MTQFMTEIQLQKSAPSIFATSGAGNVSSRYGFIPTIEVIKGLGQAGFLPVAASQSRCTNADRKDFSKHMIRFRHENYAGQDGIFPEIVMVNSHDGSSSYQLRAGVYRLVCSNGMIVGNDYFMRRIKHTGDVIEKVVESASDLIEIAPISVERCREWQGIELSKEQAHVFAEAAIGLKWEKNENEQYPVKTDQMLIPRRHADMKKDLWTAFNVVQENIIRGGIRYRTEDGTRNKTRPVNSVNENVRLNTALWTLTEKMAQLVK